MKTEVHFQSDAFNSTQPKDHFVNPDCYGDDVCRWLIQELRRRDIRTDDEPLPEDFGWYVVFWVDGAKHFFVTGFQRGDDAGAGHWIGWLERAGVLRELLGRQRSGISPRAVQAIDGILTSSADVRAVSWHER